MTKSDSYRSRNDLNHVCYSDSVRQIKTTYTSMILMGWNPYSPILKICVSCYFSFGIYIRYIVPIGKYCFLSDFLYCSFILLNLLRWKEHYGPSVFIFPCSVYATDSIHLVFFIIFSPRLFLYSNSRKWDLEKLFNRKWTEFSRREKTSWVKLN